MKIAILGTSGSGKSTLAKRLGERYGLPVLHMDTVHFLPGWVERPFAEEEAMVRQFLDENAGGWVIDGNYSKTCYARRLKKRIKHHRALVFAAGLPLAGDTALAAEQRPCEGVVCARMRREDRCRICPLDPPRWAYKAKVGEDGEDRGKVSGEICIGPELAGELEAGVI